MALNVAGRSRVGLPFFVKMWTVWPEVQSSPLTNTFHFGVGSACNAEKFGASLLKPDRVGGVVDDSHGVRFGIADFDTCGIDELIFHVLNIVKVWNNFPKWPRNSFFCELVIVKNY